MAVWAGDRRLRGGGGGQRLEGCGGLLKLQLAEGGMLLGGSSGLRAVEEGRLDLHVRMLQGRGG